MDADFRLAMKNTLIFVFATVFLNIALSTGAVQIRRLIHIGRNPVDARGKQDNVIAHIYPKGTAFEYKDMGYASAVSLVLFIIIIILSFIEQKKNSVDLPANLPTEARCGSASYSEIPW